MTDTSNAFEQGFWEDLRFPASKLRRGAGGKPDFDETNIGFLFPQNDTAEKLFLNVQMPHTKILGTSVYPHIHYVQDEAEVPVFKIDYRWYNNSGDPTVDFTTVATTGLTFTYSSGSILQIANFAAISPPANEGLSSMLDIRLYRDDNVVTGDVLVKEFDLHYMQTGFGSVDLGTKELTSS